MSSAVAARLRSLAQEHYDGRLDLAGYRALRAPLLDSLLLNGPSAPALDTTQPRGAPREAQRDAITRPGRPHVAPPQVSVPSGGPLVGSRRLSQLAIVMAVAIVSVSAVGVSMWLERRPARSEAAGSGASGTTTPATAGVKTLLDGFAARGDWSDASVTTLNAALLELGGGRIVAAARDEEFQRFVDELRRRLKEQQALSPARMTVDNSPLAALAVTVGIDLNSPDAALHISPLPPAPAAPVAVAAPRAPQAKVAAALLPQPRVSQPAHVAAEAAAVAAVAPGRAAGDTAVAATVPDACQPGLLGSHRPLCHDALPGGLNGPELVLVPAGAAAQSFAVSVAEISADEFKQFCESTHRSCASQRPANDAGPGVSVSWDEARAYADWLTGVTHHHYSLPTQAQWDYACHAAFRLLHTVGNVREWVADAPGTRDVTTGFRIVRDLQ